MRVQVVDPPAFTPPYDRSLCAALARAGAEVELVTSRFAFGSVPNAEGYRVREAFYRRSNRLNPLGRPRRLARAAEHLGDMARFRARAVTGDVTHYQWLSVPWMDWSLVPPARARVLTLHGWLRKEGWSVRPPAGLRRLFARMDMIVALSEYGASRLIETASIPPDRVRVIPHGAFDYLPRIPDPTPLPAELAETGRPVVLAFGLLRAYKGTDLLIEAFRELPDAELWVVGQPLGIDVAALRERAAELSVRVRFVSRFIADREIPAIFRRADIVALPYRDAEQSGVLYTALAFGKPIVLSDVGGFPEVAARGAARLVSAGDRDALAAALGELLADDAARAALGDVARRAAEGPYSWDAIAAQTLALYRQLLDS